MTARRVGVAAAALALLAGTRAVVWSGLDWPPPRLVLESSTAYREHRA